MHITIRHLLKILTSSKLCSKEPTKTSCKDRSLPVYHGLERFELLLKIGDGAFSNVFKARDKKTGRLVAIKVAHKQVGAKKRIKCTNVLKEAQIMRNLHHPNLVHLLNFSESKEAYYLVLDLCDGGELYHHIVQLTYFSEDLARHVICQVAAGVQYLHEEFGVVHRDIKPENILISNKNGIGHVKLADFGLSKVIHGTERLTPCGTLGYTAPEVVTDQRYSKSVDMWAIGCVLYTMLCGYTPFHGDDLVNQVVHGHYSFMSPWWDPISPCAKDLISHLLCVDPDQRYTVQQFFAHPWTQKPQYSIPSS